MKKFNTVEEAKEYAQENLYKHDSEVVDIAGKKTWISGTSLPLEERFRTPIEETVAEFLKEMGYCDFDALCDITAEVSEVLINKIREKTPLGIECAYVNF